MSTSDGQITMVQGRIVWTGGDLFKGQIKTEFNTDKPKLNNLGEQIREYGFGLAVPKSVLGDSSPGKPGHIWAVLHSEAQKIFPNGLPPGFAMKFKDGDGVDHKGVPFTAREGYAGHIVITCTTTLPIKWFRWENGQNVMINEGIKCGDYVNVQLQVKAHAAIGQGKPGLYVNPLAVQLVGYGKEIINVPSADAVFGTTMPPVPQGASLTPVAPQGQGMLVPTPAPQNAMVPGFQQPAPVPQGVAQPNFGVIPQPLQPAAQPQGFPQTQQVTPQVAGMPMPPGFGQQ